MLICDSNKITASGTSTLDYVQALESHFNGPSNHFTLQNTLDDTGGSGDYGIEITPDDAGEGWAAGIFFDASFNVITAFLDPNDAISDPTDPSSASPAANSPGGYFVHDFSAASYTPSTEFLVSETSEALCLLFKHEDHSDAHDFGMLGRVFKPAFTNDTAAFLDGLGVHGTTVQLQDNNGSYRVGETDWITVRADDDEQVTQQFPDQRLRPRPVALRDTNTEQVLGHFKYYFFWLSGQYQVLERIDDGSDEGYLVFTDSFGNARAMPWDTSVQPGLDAQ